MFLAARTEAMRFCWSCSGHGDNPSSYLAGCRECASARLFASCSMRNCACRYRCGVDRAAKSDLGFCRAASLCPWRQSIARQGCWGRRAGGGSYLAQILKVLASAASRRPTAEGGPRVPRHPFVAADRRGLRVPCAEGDREDGIDGGASQQRAEQHPACGLLFGADKAQRFERELSAAHLKFLHAQTQVRLGTSNRNAALEL